VNADPTNNDPGAEKRRSARLLHSVPIIVTGTDALGQPFKESTATVMVSCTGCKYRSTHYVPKNSTLTVEINRGNSARSRRLMQARVVWVQRPSNYRDQFHIAVEFEVPGNVWGIASPPENWFPHPEDMELEIPVTEPIDLASFNAHGGRSQISGPYSGSFTSSVETIERPDSRLAKGGSQPHMTAATTIVAEIPKPPASAEKIVLAMPKKETIVANLHLEASVQSVVKEVLAKELGVFRSQIETQVSEAVAAAVQASLKEEAGLAIKKILEQSDTGVTAIMEQAEITMRKSSEQFDERIKTVAESVTFVSAVTATAAKPRSPRKSAKRKSKVEVTQEA
jgi:PilZ domain